MIVQLTLAGILAAAQPATPDLATCRDGASPWVDVGDAHHAYAARAVAIVNAALARDMASLRSMVSASFGYGVRRGDAGYWGQQHGPDGAIQLFTALAPSNYQYSTPFAGPFSRDLCAGGTVELVLTGGEEAGVLEFHFEGTLLVRVTGYIASVTQGQLRRPHVD